MIKKYKDFIAKLSENVKTVTSLSKKQQKMIKYYFYILKSEFNATSIKQLNDKEKIKFKKLINKKMKK